MALRFGIRAGLGLLAVVLVAVGLTAIHSLSVIRDGLQHDLQGGRGQGPVAGELLNALQVHEAQLLASVQGGAEPVPPMVHEEQRSTLEAAMSRLLGRAEAAGTEAMSADVEALWEEYQRQMALLTAAPPGEAARSQATRVLVSLSSLRRQLRALTKLEQERLDARLDRLISGSRITSYSIAAGVAFGLFLALWIAHTLAMTITRPIVRVARSIDRAIIGELHLRLPMHANESLNTLALSVNRLLENLQQVTEESRRRIAQERDLATGLIETFPAPTVIVNSGGEVLMANAAARLVLTGAAGNDAIAALSDAVRAGGETFSGGGVSYAVTRTGSENARTFRGQVVHFAAVPSADERPVDGEVGTA